MVGLINIFAAVLCSIMVADTYNRGHYRLMALFVVLAVANIISYAAKVI